MVEPSGSSAHARNPTAVPDRDAATGYARSAVTQHRLTRKADVRLQLGHLGLDPLQGLHHLVMFTPSLLLDVRDATDAMRSERKPRPTNISAIPMIRPLTVVG